MEPQALATAPPLLLTSTSPSLHSSTSPTSAQSSSPDTSITLTPPSPRPIAARVSHGRLNCLKIGDCSQRATENPGYKQLAAIDHKNTKISTCFHVLVDEVPELLLDLAEHGLHPRLAPPAPYVDHLHLLLGRLVVGELAQLQYLVRPRLDTGVRGSNDYLI